MKIALLGTRGIPANYGGFETCVEELAPRLAALGHDVTVYCRVPQIDFPGDLYRGVTLVKLPTIRNKYLDTIAHSTLSALHAILHRYDVTFMFGVGNSPVCILLRLGRIPVLLNVDGLDWQREKWPGWAKRALRLAGWLSVRSANRTITDSRNVQEFYRSAHGVNLEYIPYGAAPGPARMNGTLTRHELSPNGYFLYVGRLEPENQVGDLIDATGRAALNIPTVVVGDAPYAERHIRDLRDRASGNVRFTGAIYGDGYWELNHFAYAYIFPVSSSGTHPALIEAMACGNCVLARDTPDNRAVGGNAVRYYSTVDELAGLMQWATNSPLEVRRLGQLATERAVELYNWERVTTEYLALAEDVLANRVSRRTLAEKSRDHAAGD